MSKNLTILFYPWPATGHVNSCVGLAQMLFSRGHKIVFVVDQPFKGLLVKYGYEEEVLNTPLDPPPNQESDDTKPGQSTPNRFLDSGTKSSFSTLEKMIIILKSIAGSNFLNRLPAIELEMELLLNKYKPDIIVMDQFVPPWTLLYSGKPWINIWSSSPLIIEDEMTPPIGSGYPANSDRNGWIEFKQLIKKYFPFNEYKEYLKTNGFPTDVVNKGYIESPFLNIYNYPKELDYTDIRPLPHKWFAVDSFIRKGEESFELPVQLKGWKGKLIYLSLGSICSANIELMKRLVNILSKSKHKFIVSKGLFGDKYELADNMWGQKSVPQTKVLPLVDLVLTHGGHNTVTETFYFGKPMIVFPLCYEQYDNAQRIEEKGFGVRLDPYLCSEEELLNAIELLLNNTDLKERLSLASTRIQSSDSLERVGHQIELLVN